MSNIDQSDIDQILDNWIQAKRKIADNEAKIAKYKKLITKVMEYQDTNEISSKYYTLKKRHMTRSTISKKDLPPSLWNEYSKSSSHSAFFISEN